MENEITAHRAGKITELNVAEGGSVAAARPWRRSNSRGRSRSVERLTARAAPADRGFGAPRYPGWLRDGGSLSTSVARPRPGAAGSPAAAGEDARFARGGPWRKRWRYVAAFCDELLVCAARIRIGPLGQTFWVVWDRDGRAHVGAHPDTPPGGARRGLDRGIGGDGDGPTGRPSTTRPTRARWFGSRPASARCGDVRAFLRFGAGAGSSAVCPTDEGQYVWTRKRADVPVECDVRIGERRWRIARREAWRMSRPDITRITPSGAGRRASGATTDGRSVGWNLVSGINDPPQRSERAIWVDGEPSEPGPVSFDDLDAIDFDDGSRLEFSSECERRREQNRCWSALRLPPAVRHRSRARCPAASSSSAASASWSATTPTGERRVGPAAPASPRIEAGASANASPAPRTAGTRTGCARRGSRGAPDAGRRSPAGASRRTPPHRRRSRGARPAPSRAWGDTASR